MRWRLAIQEFDFSVAYIKGERNNVADGMSRSLPEPPSNKEQSAERETERPTILNYLSGAVPMPSIISTVPQEWYQHLDRESRP